jgi:hypothetical protein
MAHNCCTNNARTSREQVHTLDLGAQTVSHVYDLFNLSHCISTVYELGTDALSIWAPTNLDRLPSSSNALHFDIDGLSRVREAQRTYPNSR